MSELPGSAQPVPPVPSLYSVLNNTQLVTINATNAQVTRTLSITGLPADWACDNLTWNTSDCALYGLWSKFISSTSSSNYLVRLDPVTGAATTSATLGSYFWRERSVLYEGLVYDDASRGLVVSHRSTMHTDYTSDEIGLFSTDGHFTLLCNDGADNDILLYDSRRDLLYMVDVYYNGIASDYFGRITLTQLRYRADWSVSLFNRHGQSHTTAGLIASMVWMLIPNFIAGPRMDRSRSSSVQ